MIFPEDVELWFGFQPTMTKERMLKYDEINSHAYKLALIILKHTPCSADQSAALRKLRECVMTANASIACECEPA